MSTRKENCNCQPNSQDQQNQQNPPPTAAPPICKKEMAMMQLLEEQMKPPPLQINFKVGVPKPKNRYDDNDNSEFMPQRNRRDTNETRGCCPQAPDPPKMPCDKKK